MPPTTDRPTAVPDEGPRDVETGWAFRSAGMEPRPGEVEAFQRRMTEALRVAPGFHGEIRWTWRTGPDGGATIGADTLESVRWVQRVFLPAFPVGRWVPLPPGSRIELGPPDMIARAAPDSLGPFRSLSDPGPPWAESILALLGSLPGGVRMDWRLRPVRPGRHRAPTPPPELQPQPPGFRPVGIAPLARRSLSDRAEERRLGPHWAVSGTVHGAACPSARETIGRLVRLTEAASRREGGCGFAFRRPGWWSRGRPVPVLLGSNEVGSMFPTPWSRCLTEVDPVEGRGTSLLIGADGSGVASRLWFEPDQGRHLVILGETGMGKSSLLVRLARQASGDHGLVLFDPIGDTARSVLAALPLRALERVLWVSPVHSPVGINALASLRPAPGASPLRAERALGDLVAALRRVRSLRYSDTPFWGPRIEETVSQALRAAACFPGGTIVDAERLLSSPGRPPHGVPPEARAAVDDLRARVLDRPEEVDGTRRLLAEITRSAVLQRMLCQREPRSSVAEWVRPGRVVVISGDASEAGEAASRYLLAVLLALVWAELLSRPSAQKVFVALDEAQWFAHDSAAEAFRLGRRCNVHLWLATQALASLPDAVREAARTNAADLVVYRGSPDEAIDLHRWVPSVHPETLLSLPRGRAAVLSGKGHRVDWVSIGPPTLARAIDAATDAAAETSRPYWVSEPGPEPGAEAVEIGGAAEGPPELAAEVRGLLLVLWAAALDADPSPTVEILLPAVRVRLDPGGTLLRRVGSELRRVGALSDSRQAPEGHVWRIERAALSRLLPGGVGPEELAAATAQWREIAPRALLDRSRQSFKQ